MPEEHHASNLPMFGCLISCGLWILSSSLCACCCNWRHAHAPSDWPIPTQLMSTQEASNWKLHVPGFVVEAVNLGIEVQVVLLAGGHGGCPGARGFLGSSLASVLEPLLALARIPHVLVQVLGVREVALLRARIQRNRLLEQPCAQPIHPLSQFVQRAQISVETSIIVPSGDDDLLYTLYMELASSLQRDDGHMGW